MARQSTVDESGVTDCVSSLLFVLLFCSLCSLSVQFVARCCVVSVWLLSVCCSSIRSVVLHCFCCRFISCGCAHGIILLEPRLPCLGWPCVAWPGCRASAVGFCLALSCTRTCCPGVRGPASLPIRPATHNNETELGVLHNFLTRRRRTDKKTGHDEVN